MTATFELIAGDDAALVVTVTDPATDQPVSLAGATVRWGLFALSGAAVVEKTSPSAGVTINDAASGVFEVQIAGADTQDLAGDYRHEAEVTSAGGAKSTVVQGIVSIVADLLRPA